MSISQYGLGLKTHSYEIRILNHDLIEISRFYNFEALKYSRVYNDISTFSLALYGEDAEWATENLKMPDALNYVVDIYRTESSRQIPIREGVYFIRLTNPYFDEQGVLYFIIGGESLEKLLMNRLIDAKNDSRSPDGRHITEAGRAAKVISDLVNHHLGRIAASDRRLAPRELNVNYENIGKRLGGRWSYDNLFDIVKGLADTGNVQFYIDIDNESRTFEFNCGRFFTDRSRRNNLDSGHILLTEELNNLIEPSLLFDYQEEQNYAYIRASSSNDNDEELILRISDDNANLPYNRIEFEVNGSRDSKESSNTKLITDGREALKENRPAILLKFPYTESPNNLYKTHWDLGDIISAKFINILNDYQVTKIDVSVEDGEEEIEIELEKYDLEDDGANDDDTKEQAKAPLPKNIKFYTGTTVGILITWEEPIASITGYRLRIRIAGGDWGGWQTIPADAEDLQFAFNTDGFNPLTITDTYEVQIISLIESVRSDVLTFQIVVANTNSETKLKQFEHTVLSTSIEWKQRGVSSVNYNYYPILGYGDAVAGTSREAGMVEDLDTDTWYALELNPSSRLKHGVIFNTKVEGTERISPPPSSLEAPTNFISTTITSNSVAVSWDAVGAAVSYRIRINNGEWIENILTTSYTFLNLGEGVRYNIDVQSYDSLQYSASITLEVITLDNTVPIYVHSIVDRTNLDITFNEPLLATSIPAVGAFNVQVAGSRRTVSTVSISGSVVRLDLSSPVMYQQTVTVAYTKPNSNSIRDIAGNITETFTAQSVTNNTPDIDVNAPTLSSATVNADTLVLTFNEVLNTASTPAASAFTVDVTEPDTEAPVVTSATINDDTLTITFHEVLDTTGPAVSAYTVKVGGSSVSINSASVSGITVVIILSSGVNSSATVTFSYTAPNTNPLQDPSGNAVENITDRAVTNNTP